MAAFLIHNYCYGNTEKYKSEKKNRTNFDLTTDS